MARKKPFEIDMSPAVGSSLRNWLRLITSFRLSPKYYLRALVVTLVILIGLPFRLYEEWRLKKKVRNTRMEKDPIFILGHWRSGTTLIHNIMVQDSQFGFITLLQAMFPRAFMTTRFFQLFMDIFMPETRPMDNMKLAVKSPQEEELAMSNQCTASFYHGWYFPRSMMDFYRKYVAFEGISSRRRQYWKEEYTYLLKKASLHMGGKQLVLKNPPNTARIPVLLELFPNAKFIHIYRNPYTVFRSTKKLYQKAVPRFLLQKVNTEALEPEMRSIYEQMMRHYFEHKALIPPANLVEIQFEKLEDDAMAVMEQIYSGLGLEGFEQARPVFQAYLDSLGGYQKNVHQFDKSDIEKVNREWGFTIEEWGYERRH